MRVSKNYYFLLFMLMALPLFGQTFGFEPIRVSYDIEYKLKTGVEDTTILIPDSTGFLDISVSWQAVTRFDGSDNGVDFDSTGGWVSIASDYKQTNIRKLIQIGNGIYSFRVWSKYAHPSGNVVKSLTPSPEYMVRFQSVENPPASVTMPVRFEIQ